MPPSLLEPEQSAFLLDRLLTLIITTSPTPSAPTTDLLSAVIASFHTHCTALLNCPVIVVFDTYDHVVEQARLKKGQVTPEGARVYDAYKENVKALVTREFLSQTLPSLPSLDWEVRRAEAEYGSPGGRSSGRSVDVNIHCTRDRRITFMEPEKRLGFGLAVRSALREADTPYVWIHQHDWALDSHIPIANLLDAMRASTSSTTAPIRYVCLPSPRTVEYEASMHVARFPVLRDLSAALTGRYPAPTTGEVVPLTPLYFWHDKPHVVERRHYLERVFPSQLAIGRGMFIEDSIGQRARNGMKEGQWARWACWLFAPGDGKQVCVRHLHGRVWKGEEDRRENEKKWDALKSGKLDKVASEELCQDEQERNA
ncbi:hypothetical protein BN1723_010059, partial [Verticillium longisporum]